MMTNADAFMDKNVLEMDSYIRLINGRCVNLNSTVELIKHHLKTSDDLGLMTYFA